MSKTNSEAMDGLPLRIGENIVYMDGKPLTLGEYRAMSHSEKKALLMQVPLNHAARADQGRFSKRHYEAIAHVLRDINAQMDTLGIHNALRGEITEMMTARFALMLAHDSKLFDSFKFKDAVAPVEAARRRKADGRKITAR